MTTRHHAQHMKRLAEKRRRYELVNRHFAGFIVSPRFYAYLLCHIDEIAAIGKPSATNFLTHSGDPRRGA